MSEGGKGGEAMSMTYSRPGMLLVELPESVAHMQVTGGVLCVVGESGQGYVVHTDGTWSTVYGCKEALQ